MAKKMTKAELAMTLERKSSERYSYMILMNLSKADLQSVYDREFKVKVLKDERLYDNKGNVIDLDAEPTGVEPMEPYDPSYLDGDTENPYKLSAWEKKFLRKVSILQKKIRKEGYEWLDNWQCFRVEKYINSDYPTYRYVRVNMDENDYSFGTEKEDLFYDGKVSEVVAEVKHWVNSNIIKK